MTDSTTGKGRRAFTLPQRAAGVVALGLLAGLALAALYFRLDPARYPFPRCPFYLLTGLYCPGCGTQRALHALLHGRLCQAASLNLLAVLYAPVLVFGAADGVRALATGQVRRTSFLYHPGFGRLIVITTVLFAVLRNLPSALGTWLAP
ncbi:DUF2752 domain-containing protein [Hymenobacter sp. BT491]|uniref:DUF2752 domain-containing protein n=1 Tax=Hymenobacter sp. BT491 TaxID=2766779 RepID=UPI00165357E0|nr:DUF2752 domain-containing protein [Hymenobacter sp. BT491]MBC6992418.1 DUF2752 domain-containing protein [Hymenobacter sp. BT491]